MAFIIRRGTNISHWLSQSDRRREGRERWFTRDDVNRIAEWGFDHIRLPFDEVQLWSENEKREPEAWHLMESALDWCQTAGLRVVVDFHILRSHFSDHESAQALFTDRDQHDRFLALWIDLSIELQSWSTDFLAYEILNEAVAPDPADWNRVSGEAFRLLRDREPDRTIVLGSNHYNSARTYDSLAIPDDRLCLLAFHDYNPMAVTHYGAGWTSNGVYNGPIAYPGPSVSETDIAELDPDFRVAMEEFTSVYDRERMLANLQPPLRRSRETGLPLYCGEFGVHHKAPIEVRDRWYADIISLFDEYGIAWANWDYKGNFGLLNSDGTESGIRSLLMGR
jgi:endoglucanase